MTPTKTEPRTIPGLMTRNPVCVGGGTTAAELAAVLVENEISGVPVVDPLERVIGVVSRTDLLHRCVEGPAGSPRDSYLSSIAEGFEGEFEASNLGVVSDFMNPEPVTAMSHESVADVARRMMEERVHRVIIVDDQLHLLGILTSLDMLRMVAT